MRVTKAILCRWIPKRASLSMCVTPWNVMNALRMKHCHSSPGCSDTTVIRTRWKRAKWPRAFISVRYSSWSLFFSSSASLLSVLFGIWLSKDSYEARTIPSIPLAWNYRQSRTTAAWKQERISVRVSPTDCPQSDESFVLVVSDSLYDSSPTMTSIDGNHRLKSVAVWRWRVVVAAAATLKRPRWVWTWERHERKTKRIVYFLRLTIMRGAQWNEYRNLGQWSEEIRWTF